MESMFNLSGSAILLYIFSMYSSTSGISVTDNRQNPKYNNNNNKAPSKKTGQIVLKKKEEEEKKDAVIEMSSFLVSR